MTDDRPAPTGTDFDCDLAALGELAVSIGVNVQRGQELIVSAPLEAAPLVRHVAHAAYRRGAAAVTCLYDDPVVIRDRLVMAEDEWLDHAPSWIYHGMAESLRAGAARLQIAGPYPDLLSGVPPERIARAHRALARASRHAAEIAAALTTNCSLVPFVTASWARLVFPDDDGERARDRLWQTVFAVTRASCGDPPGEWEAHLRLLGARRDTLQARRFRALRFFDGRTDLTVGLAADHRWSGGRLVSGGGIAITPAMPAEEVAAALDHRLTTGRVHFARPLALGGTLVRNLYAEFKGGSLTAMRADSGLETVERLLAGEETRRLQEVGLVPGSSRVARTGLLFWNPLFDRNAASHVAFSSGTAGGGLHIDAMVGHDGMHVDGVTPDGQGIPVMRAGEFVLAP